MVSATVKVEVKSAVNAQKLTGNRKLETFLAILTELEKLDISVERKLKVSKNGLIASIVILGASIVFGIAVMPILFSIIPFASIGLAVFLIFYFKYKAIDMDNGFRLYLKPLLTVLKDDIKKERAISVTIDFLPITDKANFKSKSDKYSRGLYHKCYDYLYERELLTLKMPLFDGNRLALSVHEALIKMKKTKKNPRGKIKTKTKFKRRTTIMIQLRANPAKYKCLPVPETLTDNLIKKIAVKPTAKGPLLTLIGVSKIKQKIYSPDPQTTLRLMATLYSYLKPATASE